MELKSELRLVAMAANGGLAADNVRGDLVGDIYRRVG